MIWLTWATVAGPAWLRQYYILKCTPCRQPYRAQISGVNRCPLPLKRWPLGKRLKRRLARTSEHDVVTPKTPSTSNLYHLQFLQNHHFYKIIAKSSIAHPPILLTYSICTTHSVPWIIHTNGIQIVLTKRNYLLQSINCYQCLNIEYYVLITTGQK